MIAKRVFCILLIFFVGVMISGCFELEERIVLHKDGSGTLEIEYWTMEDVNIQDDHYNFPDNETDIRKEVEDKYTSKKIKLLDFNVREKEKSRYVRFKVEFDDILDLNDIPQFQDNEIRFWKSGKQMEFKRTIYFDNDKSDTDTPDNWFEKLVVGLVAEGLSQIKFRFEIETPYEISESNARWMPGDKRAIWKYNLSEVFDKNTLEMTFTTK